MPARKGAVSVLIAILFLSLGFTHFSFGQDAVVSGNDRKVTLRVAPTCPELARKMHIQGIVKLEAVVRPNGTVKTTKVIGGNPVLVVAASDAVSKWKFEPAPSETTELVQLTFVAQ